MSAQQDLQNISTGFNSGIDLFNQIFNPPNTGNAGMGVNPTGGSGVPNASGSAANNPVSGNGSILNSILGTPNVNTTVGLSAETKTILTIGGVLIASLILVLVIKK